MGDETETSFGVSVLLPHADNVLHPVWLGGAPTEREAEEVFLHPGRALARKAFRRGMILLMRAPGGRPVRLGVVLSTSPDVTVRALGMGDVRPGAAWIQGDMLSWQVKKLKEHPTDWGDGELSASLMISLANRTELKPQEIVRAALEVFDLTVAALGGLELLPGMLPGTTRYVRDVRGWLAGGPVPTVVSLPVDEARELGAGVTLSGPVRADRSQVALLIAARKLSEAAALFGNGTLRWAAVSRCSQVVLACAVASVTDVWPGTYSRTIVGESIYTVGAEEGRADKADRANGAVIKRFLRAEDVMLGMITYGYSLTASAYGKATS